MATVSFPAGCPYHPSLTVSGTRAQGLPGTFCFTVSPPAPPLMAVWVTMSIPSSIFSPGDRALMHPQGRPRAQGGHPCSLLLTWFLGPWHSGRLGTGSWQGGGVGGRLGREGIVHLLLLGDFWEAHTALQLSACVFCVQAALGSSEGRLGPLSLVWGGRAHCGLTGSWRMGPPALASPFDRLGAQASGCWWS